MMKRNRYSASALCHLWRGKAEGQQRGPKLPKVALQAGIGAASGSLRSGLATR